MTRKIYILFFSGLLSLGFFNLTAQVDYNKKKIKNENAINTKKETPKQLTEHIVGTWQVDEVHKGKKDITNSDTLEFNRTIIFDEEGKYVSHGGEEKIDSGLYRLNENHNILYLESETGDKITEWNITFSNTGMTLQPRGTYPHAQSFKYTYSRADGGN